MPREVPLSRGMMALVDDDQYELIVASGPWHAVPGKRTFYARHTSRAHGVYVNLFMHTLVAGVSPADHVNGDGLDNRRSNLRPLLIKRMPEIGAATAITRPAIRA